MTSAEKRAKHAAYMRDYRKKNPDKFRKIDKKKTSQRKADPSWPGRQRSYKLKRLYGITLDEYSALVESQDGTCKLCDYRHDDSHWKTRLVVDHDHDSGNVRGLLCNPCNTALGRLGDSVEGLTRALNYLKS